MVLRCIPLFGLVVLCLHFATLPSAPVQERKREHRPPPHTCPLFSCKAGKRPVQKAESEFKPFALDLCPNNGSVYQQKRDQDQIVKYQPVLTRCCYEKDLCVASCGMSWETCYFKFWQCAEALCLAELTVWAREQTDAYAEASKTWKEKGGTMNEQEILDMNRREERSACHGMARMNDATQIWTKRTPYLRTDLEPENPCKKMDQVQAEACDCVPAAEHDKAVLKRTEDFFRIHNPQRLNKKGNMKNMTLWRTWKGKRPEMFLLLMLDYHASVDISTDPVLYKRLKPSVEKTEL